MYKGCHVINTCDLGEGMVPDRQVHDAIVSMIHYSDANGCIEKGCTNIHKCFSLVNTNQMGEFPSKDMHGDSGDSMSQSDNDMSQHAFGGLTEAVAIMSPNRVLPSDGSLQRPLLIAVQDTENYHLFMAMNDAATTPSQIQDMHLLMIQATNWYLAENRSTSMTEGETTFLGEDGSRGHRNGKQHKQ
jgi:hypothetical protein